MAKARSNVSGPHQDRLGTRPGNGDFGAMVVTISSSVAAGSREDGGGPPIVEKGSVGFSFSGGRGAVDNVLIKGTLDMEWFRRMTAKIR